MPKYPNWIRISGTVFVLFINLCYSYPYGCDYSYLLLVRNRQFLWGDDFKHGDTY